MFRKIFAVVSLSFLCLVAHAQNSPKSLEEATSNRFAQELKVQHLHAKWRARIQSLLDAGKLPKIDMETSWSEDAVRGYVPEIFPLLDELGIALIAADGRQRKADGSAGYRWSNYMSEAAEKYPDRFIPTTNGGTSPNWLEQKDGTGSFIEQLEKQILTGRYALIGELDFRHYMSTHQCAAGSKDRDNSIPLTSTNGHRVFRLSHDTGVPFVIHLEPEDEPLAQLEKMLDQYPKAIVVVAHFGQLRHPERQKGFTPQKVRSLFSRFPNLNWDLSTGWPNREYRCAGLNNDRILKGDTVLWAATALGQSDTVSPEWRAIFTEFHDRFVFATDFGSGRPPLHGFLRDKVVNFERIVRDLPREVQHAFAYKNAWRLLTGKPWE
jgi:predicted TIM-barrel fold metal-dependent hydrolase